MPPRKAAKTEKSGTAAEAKAQREAAERAERTAWIATNDPLLDVTSSSFTISELFSTVIQQQSFENGSTQPTPCDWTAFRTALTQRTAESPRWYIQLRLEDLLLDPDGLRGVRVESFVVAEASEPTLSPAHYVVKEHWPNSDIEDNAPERVLSIAEQGLKWIRVVQDSGADTNTFLLARPKKPASSVPSFSFGAAAPAAPAPAPAAPVAFGFGAPAAPSASPISFGFGAAPAAPAAAPITFGFGAAPAAPAAAAPIAFSFGAATPAASTTAAAESAPFDAVAVAKKSAPFKSLPASDIMFVLWSTTRLKSMIQEFRSGSRIVKEDFALGNNKTVKLVMQNDLKDHVDQVAEQLLLKMFSKSNDDVRKVDKWLNDCPVYDSGLAPHLQKFRAKYLKEVANDSSDYQHLTDSFLSKIETALQQMVDVRKELVRMAVSDAEEILHLVKEKKIAEKSTFRLLKFYPKNDIVAFRPFGKVSGISEMGEHVDFCEPEMYKFKNTLLKQ